MLLHFFKMHLIGILWTVLISFVVFTQMSLVFADTDADTVADTDVTGHFKNRDLDWMIEHGKPREQGTVQLTLFKPIQIRAVLKSLPAARKTVYLQSVMRDFGISPLPKVDQGIDVTSHLGKPLNLYIEENAAARVANQLTLNEELTFLGYHVYNSDHGPGILISGFIR